VTSVLPGLVLGHDRHQLGSRPNQAEVTEDDIEKLGDFI
jgi:hypothetical protein